MKRVKWLNKDLSYPWVEVLTWMPLQELYEDNEKGKRNEKQRTD